MYNGIHDRSLAYCTIDDQSFAFYVTKTYTSPKQVTEEMYGMTRYIFVIFPVFRILGQFDSILSHVLGKYWYLKTRTLNYMRFTSYQIFLKSLSILNCLGS